MSSDIRAALERLLGAVDVYEATGMDVLDDAIAAARVALKAEPVGEGPSDDSWWHELLSEIARVQYVAVGEGQGPRFDLAEAVARWCHPATPPAPEPGEVGELVAALKVIDKMQQEWVLIGNDDDGTASPSLSMPISLRRFTVLRDALSRAAALLQRQAAPAPVVVPMAVGECPHCGYEGEMARAPQAGEGEG